MFWHNALTLPRHATPKRCAQASPDWMQRFAIFAREQEQLQRMSSARGGGESGVDLVSYVEYQKNHR